MTDVTAAAPKLLIQALIVQEIPVVTAFPTGHTNLYIEHEDSHENADTEHEDSHENADTEHNDNRLGALVVNPGMPRVIIEKVHQANDVLCNQVSVIGFRFGWLVAAAVATVIWRNDPIVKPTRGQEYPFCYTSSHVPIDLQEQLQHQG